MNGRRSAPAGGENPLGFHPFVNFIPILAEESADGILPAVTMPDWGWMNM
jgi:hypothetical protein